MYRKLIVVAGAVAIFAAVLFAQEGNRTESRQPESAAGSDAEARDAENAAIAKFVESYTAAFNKNDARAVAAHWSENGVYVDRETGERSEGREHLLGDFQRLFDEHAGARLSLELNGTRRIKPDVVAIEGTAKALLPGQEPTTTAFSGLVVKHGDRWLLESVNETPPAAPASGLALRDLEWMIGHWVDESDAVQVDTTVRWGASGTFLVRTFVVQPPDEELLQGTQVIGWDPRAGQIRSWKFFSDGSFGEDLWSKSGDEWLVRGTHTLADGRLASGTQVIQRVDDNTQLVRLMGRDIDGAPVPSIDTVKVVRVREAEDREADRTTPERPAASPDPHDGAPARRESDGGAP